jgi:hypothetical protein
MNAEDRLICRDATRFPTFSKCLGTWTRILFSLNSHSLKRACRFSVDVTRFTVDGKPHDLVSNPPGVLLHIDQTFSFRFVNPGAAADPEIPGTSSPFVELFDGPAQVLFLPRLTCRQAVPNRSHSR